MNTAGATVMILAAVLMGVADRYWFILADTQVAVDELAYELGESSGRDVFLSDDESNLLIGEGNGATAYLPGDIAQGCSASVDRCGTASACN